MLHKTPLKVISKFYVTPLEFCQRLIVGGLTCKTKKVVSYIIQ